MLQRAADWLDQRTGWRARVRDWAETPIAGGAPWAWAMAASVGACFGVLAVTGVLLMTAYAPSPQAAWASVHYVQFVQDRGWIVRGLHYWAAQGLLVLAAAHVAHGALAASYRKPREVTWWLTLLVLALAVGGGITGGLLPWDQRGWWARVVEGNIVGLAPGVGGWIQQVMEGGTELGALGLARAYAVHVAVVPVILFLVLWVRRGLVRKHGWSDSPGASKAAYISQAARNVAVGVVVVLALFAITGAARGAPLDAPADPMSDYPARPEWFLLPLFELRKLFSGSGEFWGTTLVPAAAGAYLALLPWIDKPGRSRVVVLAPFFVVAGGTLALALAATRHDARDEKFGKERAKADAQAAAAIELAKHGVPPDGALAMLRRDPELHGRDLFDKQCASCHVLGDLGDPKKATASKLDGWSTPDWIAAMIHDPDGGDYFGRGPYKTKMPSVDVRPKDKAADEPWSPMVKSDAERRAVALFLAAQGNEAGDPAPAGDDATRATGEKIVTERCTTCHLFKTQGDDDGSGEAPELSGYGSVSWTRAQVANPANPATYRDKALDEALKKHMPRFDKDLSPEDVDVVARWTRAHARGLPVR